MERRIHLLSDEDVGLILAGLTLMNRKFAKEDDGASVFLINQLYEKIDESSDVGVIFDGRVKEVEKG